MLATDVIIVGDGEMFFLEVHPTIEIFFYPAMNNCLNLLYNIFKAEITFERFLAADNFIRLY